MADSEMTNALCRTWDISTVRMVATFNGSTFYDSGNRSASENNNIHIELNKAMQELSERLNGEPDDEEYISEPGYNPENVIFTKSGSYLVTTDTQQLGVSIWQWKDEPEGVLQYSHNINNISDPYNSNEVSISFSGSSMTMNEVNLDFEEEDEGISMHLRIMSYYVCTEAK